MPKYWAKESKCFWGLFLLLWFPAICIAQYEEDLALKNFTGVLEAYAHTPNAVVFLLDESGSIGASNFPGVIKFTEMTARFLSVSEKDSRVAVVTFATNCRNHLNYIKDPVGNNMCTFLGKMAQIDYVSGGTHTGDAMVEAQKIFLDARKNANKIIILMTDGKSYGGRNLKDITTELKNEGVIMFVVGIADTNDDELYMVAASRKHVYIMRNLQYIFKLNDDIKADTVESSWDLASNPSLCDKYCSAGHDCCDINADCLCGTHGGQHECVCKAGYQGHGVRNRCFACPKGTYKDKINAADCNSCPGNSTTHGMGSISVDDCKCITGYKGRPQDNKACAAIRCSKLAAPSGGIILPSHCGDIYGSECNFKCNEGYCPYSCNEARRQSNAIHPWNILPQEKRRCEETGLWTGRDFHCEKIRCPNLNIPKHGYHNCTTSDFTFNTVCSITCNNGFTQIGSALRKCLTTGSWSGEETICTADACPALKTNQKLKIKPPKCERSNMEYQSVCQYYCKQGFKLVATDSKSEVIGERQCQLAGKWSNDYEKLSCKDAELPTITCPSSIERETNPGKATSLIYWNLPIASDNVAVDTVEIIYPQHVKKPPHAFPIGSDKIVYQVRDTSGLVNNCSFSIKVVDKEAPRIAHCPSDIEKLHGKSSALKVFWKEPEFADNSGEAFILSRNKKSGAAFYWGNPTKVIYNISDPFRNTAVCSFLVKVKGYSCPYMDPPTNGFLACDKWSDGQFCKVSCKNSYVFVSPPEPVYFCSQRTQSWTKFMGKGKLQLPWPDCAKTRKPRGVNSTVTAKYSVSECNDEDIEAVKRDFIKTARGRRFCPPNPNVSCVIKNVNVTCKMPVHRLKIKRSISNFDLSSSKGFSRKNFNVHKVSRFPHAILLRTKRQATERAELEFSFNIEIYEVETQEENTTIKNCENCTSVDSNSVFKYEFNISDDLKSEIDNVVDAKYKAHSPVIKEIVLEKTIPICENGSMLDNNTCVLCPTGTYFDSSSAVCKACPKDYYQDEEGRLQCKECPIDKLTLHTKAKELDDCKGPCSLGSYSKSGLEPCLACPTGSYADEYGSQHCTSCPPSQVTSIVGATSSSNCVFPCRPGTYSADGFPPCMHCPQGTYQPQSRSTMCQKCPNGTTTIVENADEIKFCQTFYFCMDYEPCMNGATCLSLENDYECVCPDGFSGRQCGVNINECELEECSNGGTCVDGVNNITCSCLPGYSGFRCEVNVNDCHSDICHNGGTCEDLVNDYLCHCPDGFLGKNCNENIDECASNPCKNNGTCFDSINDFRCCCPKDFTGHVCDIEVDNCAEITCLNGGTCHTTTDGFNCSCDVGFEGSVCEINIDDCISGPCNSGGTCIDGIGNVTCVCPDTFDGHYCEKGLLSEYSLKFPSPLTSNYARLQNEHRLFAITISFFMRTDYVDKDSKGTPVSYTFQDPGTGEFKDNALTLMNTNRLMLYVHGKLFHTNVVANKDFEWHHYAVTWDSTKGMWKFYVDGNIIISGDNVGKGSYLQPGIFILGQDQDSLGSSFSIGESFAGEITEFNVWDYSLTSDEIISLGKSCGFFGNIIKWPIVQSHVFGDVILEQDVEICKRIGTCPFDSCYCGINSGSLLTGRICKQRVDNCVVDPCQNGQKCINFSSISYCDCNTGYDGRRCEHDVDECITNNGGCEYLCINTLGSHKCLCSEGRQLSADDHTCFEPSICTVGNSVYNNGDKWNSKCDECTCDLGTVSCYIKACPRVACKENETLVFLPGQCCQTCLSESSCIIRENDELETFDGQIFDFYGYCKYSLINSIGGDFSIQFQTFDQSESLCTKSVILRIFCSQLVISENGALRLNDKEISMPYEGEDFFIHSNNVSEIIVQSRIGVSIDWSCLGNISVSVPFSYKKQVSGLCGNFNGNATDDLSAAEVQPDNVVTKFIESWKIPDRDCVKEGTRVTEVTNLPNSNSALRHMEQIREDIPWVTMNCFSVKPHQRKRRLEACRALWKNPFNLCHKIIDPHEYYILCIRESCLSLGNGRSHCNALLAYFIECKKHGLHLNYLNRVRSCRKYCPHPMVYKECGPECPATSISKENENCNPNRCTSGCFCQDDYVLDKDGDCILLDQRLQQ